MTAWQLLNSQFLATLVGAFVAMLVAKFGSKAAQAVAETAAAEGAASATAQARQIEEQFSSEDDRQARENGRNYRDEARGLAQQAREFLDSKAENDPDGRHRRTYDALSRYDYIPLAVALNVRGQISEKQLAAAASLFSRWRLYERGKAANKSVPETVYEEMKTALSELNG
jgi:hypothetical protein